MNIASFPSAGTFGLGAFQRQAAQRQAEQLEAQARALAAQAREARQVADEAVRRADEIEIESGGARTAADTARQAVSVGEGARGMMQRLDAQTDRLAEAVRPDGAGELYARNGQATTASPATGSLLRLSA